MRTYRANAGPFRERPYYQLSEVEKMCMDELRLVELYPETPSPIRIDRFLEKRFKVTPTYDDLPVGVLGFTVFGEKGVHKIVIARALDAEGTQSAERRIRTTMAHEGGHGLLHAHLFAFNDALLFGEADETGKPKVLCRDELKDTGRTSTVRYDGRWWEYQANMAMSALLMPRPLVQQVIEPFLHTDRFVPSLAKEARSEVVLKLAEVFDVNPVAARIRLNEIFPLSKGNQLTL